MDTHSHSSLAGRLQALFPGVMAAGLIAIAAQFVAEHHNAPAMLMALLFGMAMNFLGETGRCVEGIRFSSRTILRVGVALLGARISAELVLALGWQSLLIVVLGVVLTIGFGLLAGRLAGKTGAFSILTAGAVAICGASAAMAISAALPKSEHAERDMSFTVIAVTALSTFAMILYPVLTQLAGFDDQIAGIFLGATIHDVAQVVGAGFTVSPESGDVATLVKLVRVSLLAPVVIGVSLAFRAMTAPGERPAAVPGFVIAFAVLALLNSLHLLPAFAVTLATDVSRWALLAAIAGVGMSTSLGRLSSIGWQAASLMVANTVFLALFVWAALSLL